MIKPEHIENFKESGVIILKNVVPEEYRKTALEAGLKYYSEHQAKLKQPKAFGRSCYWPIMEMHSTHDKSLYDLMTSDLMAGVAKSLLGDTVYLFNEQFVFKPAGSDFSVRWHTDNDCGPSHLDAMKGNLHSITCLWFLTEHDSSSGGVYFLPKRREQLDSPIGKEDYPEEFVEIVASPGDMVVWCGNIYHFSEENASDKDRYVWLSVYTTKPIGKGLESGFYYQPFIKEGEKVAPEWPPSL